VSSLAPPSGIQPGSSGPVRRALARPAKRSARRIIALALMLALAFTLPPLPLPARASAASLFPDLERHWSRAYVETLARQGILGTAPGEPFRPAEPATRGEFLAWLVRALDQAGAEGSPKGEAGSPPGAHQPPPFHDVLSGHPFFAELTRAREMGLARGTEAGFFYPAAPLTRQEAALLLWRAYRAASPDRDDSSAAAASSTPTPPPATALSASLAAASPHPAGGSIPAVLSTGGPPARSSSPQAVSPGAQPLLPSSTPADLYTFADAATVAPWAREELARAVEAGLVQGEETVQPQRGRGLIRLKLLSPGKSLTRAEAATLVFRLLTKVTVELASRPSFLAQRSEKSPVPKAAAKSPPAGRNAGLAPVSLPASRNEVQSVNLKEQAASSRQNGSTGRNGDPAPSGGTGENGGAGQNGHPGQNDGAGKDSNAGPNGDPAQNSGPGQKGGSSDSRGSGSTQKGEDCAAQASPGGCAPGSGHDPGESPFFSPPADGELGVRWVEFLPPWDDAEPTATDMSFLLDPPAGKHGRVVVCGEHLCFEDGTRARFWGVGLGLSTRWPQFWLDYGPEVSNKIAARLAKLGFNAVRLFPAGFMVWLRENSLNSPLWNKAKARWESLDYFLAEAKRRGIYVYLSLSGLQNAVVPAKERWASPYRLFFDERLKDEFKEATRELLLHRNPYTGIVLAEEPQIAVVEVLNETSLIWAWDQGLLERLMEELGVDIESRWKEWHLNSKGTYPDRQAAEFISAGKGRTYSSLPGSADFERFLLDVEKEFYGEIIAHLRRLGWKGPVVCSQPFGGWSELVMMAQICDLIDVHAYWDTYDRSHPAGDFPHNSPAAWISYHRIKGKPLTVSEYSHSFAGSYEAEGPLFVAAYGLYQGVSGVWFHLYDDDAAPRFPDRLTSLYSIERNPAKLAILPVAAAMFLQGDIDEANVVKELRIDQQESIRAHLDKRTVASYQLMWWYGFDGYQPLSYGVKRVMGSNGDSVDTSLKDRGQWMTDTGQITWSYPPNTKAPFWGKRPYGGTILATGRSTSFASGFLGGREIALGPIRIYIHSAGESPEDLFAAVGAVSLDGRPLQESRHLLVTMANRTWLQNIQPGFVPGHPNARVAGIGVPYFAIKLGDGYESASLFFLSDRGYQLGRPTRVLQGASLSVIPQSPWMEIKIP